MSRVRLAYALALLGILITTGGCAESATAPEATLRGAALESKSSKPAEPTDPVAEPEEETGTITTMDSGWMTGGGRAETP
ncbi:MAG TPA: hypothetical protein VFR37_02830 [Longimicrobium sp.]|nr:hypothetical protein [Longimicrobium sp.]